MNNLREFLLNEDGYSPGIADLPILWDQIPADAMDPDQPIYNARYNLVRHYFHMAGQMPEIWEGLRRLLDTLLERHEPIPDPLQRWAFQVARGRLKKPKKGKGRPKEFERKLRILSAFRELRSAGVPQEQALKRVADALNLSSVETIRSTIRRAKAE